VTNRVNIEQMTNLEKENASENIRDRIFSIAARDTVIALTLFLFAFISRLPYQSQILYHWDSVNFAAAISQFDLANESPHPPGYIVYVWFTQAVNLFTNNPQVTMVSISIVSSALASVTLFFLGKAMFNRTVGIIAGLFLATSPMFWFYGEIALPHTLDTLFVITSAWLLYLTMRGEDRYLYPAVLTVAVAGGLRPQTLVFLLPLVLFAIRKSGVQRIIGAGVVGGVACVLWFVPLVTASGGFSTYMEIMGIFSQRFQESTSIFMGAGWAGIRGNLVKVVIYTAYGLTLTIVPLLAYGVGVIVKRPIKVSMEKAFFLFFWMAPVLLFYIAIHMGQQGLIFVYLPALLLIAAFSLQRFLWARPLLLAAGAGVIMLFNIAVFTMMAEYPFGPGTQRMLTSDTIRNSDQYFRSRIEAIEYHFEAGKTGVIAIDWRHAEYYLPDYMIIPLDEKKWDEEKWDEIHFLSTQGYLTLNDLSQAGSDSEVLFVVLFDRGLDQRDRSAKGVLESIVLENGEILTYYEVHAYDKLFIREEGIELISEQ
jgi:hypothetical protein